MTQMAVALILLMASLHTASFTMSTNPAPTMSTNPAALAWTTEFVPTNSRQHRLFCVFSRYFLQVDASGKVNGTLDADSVYARMEFQSLGRSIIRIKALATGLYVGMDISGRLFSTSNSTSVETIFNETSYSSGYHSYASFKFYNTASYDAFIAIRNNGKMKRGIHTRYTQNLIYFLTLQIS